MISEYNWEGCDCCAEEAEGYVEWFQLYLDFSLVGVYAIELYKIGYQVFIL